jgi:hypothetical protein
MEAGNMDSHVVLSCNGRREKKSPQNKLSHVGAESAAFLSNMGSNDNMYDVDHLRAYMEGIVSESCLVKVLVRQRRSR